jgi:hypothetical protein
MNTTTKTPGFTADAGLNYHAGSYRDAHIDRAANRAHAVEAALPQGVICNAARNECIFQTAYSSCVCWKDPTWNCICAPKPDAPDF